LGQAAYQGRILLGIESDLSGSKIGVGLALEQTQVQEALSILDESEDLGELVRKDIDDCCS